MFIPSNHEKLQTISEIVREGIEDHIEHGGAYYDETAGQIAALAIQTCMPELRSLQQKRIILTAGTAVLSDGEADQHFSDTHVEARLERVAIQMLVSTTDFDGMEHSLIRHDLFAVLTPAFKDPDPVDIIFGQTLYVPFETISQFESAA